MDKKPNQQRTIRQTSPQNLTMRKHTVTKRRYSHQAKILYTQQEPTFFLFEHLNTTTTARLKQQSNNTSFRPLATSTPCDIGQLHSCTSNSPHSITKHQRPLLTPPVFCSTPKQTRRPPTTSSSSSVKRKLPIVISQRRLQFTANSQSFVRHSPDESKRITMKNVKIWLL